MIGLSRPAILPLVGLVIAAFGCSADPAADMAVPEEPNKDVPFLGVDGAFTLDPLAADCPDDPRNPGRVLFWQKKEICFFQDREGSTVLADRCIYDYKGYEPDPHYFPESLNEVWLIFEQWDGPKECAAYKHVILRPPHGDGDVKRMHMRYGDESMSAKALLDMSLGDYKDANKCDPWWNVYCTAGAEGCEK